MSPGWIWISAGLALMLLEIVVPGLVVVFVGLAAAVVGIVVELGWVSSLPSQLLLWFMVSLGMVFSLRGLLQKLFPGGEERGDTDEDGAVIGRQVRVVVRCTAEPGGRVLVGGVEWDARSTHGPLQKGDVAELIRRENLTWWVSPVTQKGAND